MKIAVITPTFPPYQSGMSKSAAELARILAANNEVNTLTLTPRDEHGAGLSQRERECAEQSTIDGIKVMQLKPFLSFGFKNGGFVPQLYKILAQWLKSDNDSPRPAGEGVGGEGVIYLHYPFFGGAEVVWLFKIFHPKVKLIVHFHMDTPALSWLAKILSLPSLVIKKSLFKRADKIISASLDYVAHSSVKKYWQKWPEKFVEIPFGAHLDKFHVLPYDIAELQELRNKLGIKKGERVILFVGALDEAHSFKGVEVLLRAVSSIKYQVPSIKVIICGEGDLRSEYERQARELDIKNLVIFAGRVGEEELVRYYNLADIFVLPSVDKSEAFGMVLVEAMACGVPVMASDLPGVRSVFTNGVQGITVAPGSARHLQKKLEEYLRYPQKRLKMGRAARELVEEKYDWRKIGEKLQTIFN